jgi:hypothetical protein
VRPSVGGHGGESPGLIGATVVLRYGNGFAIERGGGRQRAERVEGIAQSLGQARADSRRSRWSGVCDVIRNRAG